jgi:DNA mismatch repair protein MSH4
MIDVSAIHSLELLQNLRNSQSKDCLIGFLNNTNTRMGGRMLRRCILQPSTLGDKILGPRYDALEELSSNEEMFYQVRQGVF